ncbi:cysteine-rich RLK (RECEPTOR-like protein kinase) 8 [Striga hermonthica]|uniref:Cysteine-rich RLK (RECEPTOR-like protein kinase) 8 n=1 Tax=Striga hermonthica TaxID=68872 RepID=A0A9N7P085_STRHE|nr:cysteine-rich RLK (RECEPTOR-like protein kinase) 8 [Striga hermonthica]
MLTIVDDYTRATWIYLMRYKAETVINVRDFLRMVEVQFGVKVNQIRTDNGGEFVNKEMEMLLKDNGIIHQRTCPYTPQQNGVVERKHRSILEVARSLAFQCKLQRNLWPYSLLVAVQIINTLPSEKLKWKSPYELLHGSEPAYGMFKVFGCLCYASRLGPNRKKFNERAMPCVFLGYISGTKGYRLYSLESKEVFVSRDVIFYEERFPFIDKKSLTPEQEPLEPVVDDFITCEPEPHVLNNERHDPPAEENVAGYDKAKKGEVCLLKRSLYGLKQASRQWNIEFSDKLIAYGFKQSPHDHCLFFKHSSHGLLALLIYVDDVLITGKSLEDIENLKSYLHDLFTIKDLGQAKYFLGLEIHRTGAGTYLSQRKYIMDIVHDLGLENSKPTTTPLPQGLNLSSLQSPPLDNPQKFRRLVGRLLYLNLSRADVSYAIQQLSQFVHSPSQRHWTADGLILPQHISSSLQPADVFTKSLGGADFSRFICKLRMRLPPPIPA